VAVLRKALTAKRTGDRIRAAAIILDRAVGDIENHAILARLDALERQGKP
jgi:hypothetical protein